VIDERPFFPQAKAKEAFGAEHVKFVPVPPRWRLIAAESQESHAHQSRDRG
jgi:hypothetical protein